jgi:NodT family efflux transporter outer membrane factor (OMF) lipoprotein
MKPALIMVAACLTLIAGCAVGPDYQPPKTNMPTNWASLSDGETNGSVNLAAWWKNFSDTNLDVLMTMAVQSNLTLRVAEARVLEARAQRGVVAADLWPSVGSSLSYSRNRWGQNTFPPLPPGTDLDYNLYSAGFDAAWELDVFGGTRRAVEAANAEIGAAEFGQRDVLVSLLAEVARNYISARGFQQRLVITHENIQAQRDVLNLTSNLFEHGLSSDVDVQQSTALLTSTEAQVPSLETGFQESVHHLAVLLGQTPGVLVNEMAVEKPIPLSPPIVPAGLPSDLLQRRPDVQRAERELAAATAHIGVATADYFPKFSLTGTAGLESISASDWFTYGSRFWNAGPTVQWELFEAGRIRANVRVQDARQEQALDTYQQTVLTALEDVENALTAYAKEQIRRTTLSQSVEANRQALELSTQLYKSGLQDFIHVLDSERSLYTSEDDLVQSDQTVSLNLVQLYKALGGGWQTVTNLTPTSTKVSMK